MPGTPARWLCTVGRSLYHRLALLLPPPFLPAFLNSTVTRSHECLKRYAYGSHHVPGSASDTQFFVSLPSVVDTALYDVPLAQEMCRSAKNVLFRTHRHSETAPMMVIVPINFPSGVELREFNQVINVLYVAYNV